MKLVRVFGKTLSDLFALITPDDHEYGLPEGLAHWDGHRWEWIQKFQNTLMLDGKTANGRFFLLEHSKGLFVGEGSSKCEYFPSPKRGLMSMHLCEQRLSIVGSGGNFLIFDIAKRKWIIVETGLLGDLYGITLFKGTYWLCGANGVLMTVEGEKVSKFPCETTNDLTAIDCNDEYLFVSGGKIKKKEGYIVQINKNRATKTLTSPHRFYSIAAFTPGCLYGATLNEGVFLFDGCSCELSLSPERWIQCLSKIGGKIFAGGRNCLLFDPPDWKEIKVDLDSGFIEE